MQVQLGGSWSSFQFPEGWVYSTDRIQLNWNAVSIEYLKCIAIQARFFYEIQIDQLVTVSAIYV